MNKFTTRPIVSAFAAYLSGLSKNEIPFRSTVSGELSVKILYKSVCVFQSYILLKLVRFQFLQSRETVDLNKPIQK